MDKAKELDHIGGTFGGNRKPTPFMCLVLKMLQIQPEKAIVLEFIKNELFKYAMHGYLVHFTCVLLVQTLMYTDTWSPCTMTVES